MADQQTEAASEATNGASANGVHVERAKMTRAEQDAADRAAFLAGGDEAEEAPAPKGSAKKPAAKDDDVDDADDEIEQVGDEDEDEDEEVDLEDDEDEDESVDRDEDENDDDAEVRGKQDPELAKRLAKVQKYEKKVREQADHRERAFVQERDAFIAEWKPKIEQYQEFEKAKSRRDVVGLLKSVGYTEDDYEDAARILYGLSKAGAAKPENREVSKRMLLERELREKVEAAEARAAAIEEKLAKRDSETEANQKLEAYIGRITKAIGDETPLVKKRMEISPKSTRKAIEKVAYELARKTGELADPKRVARAYEKKLDRTIAHASKLRGDSVASTTTKPKVKPTITVVDKTKKAPAIVAAPTKKNGSLIPDRGDMIERLRMIERGELDPDADDAD